MQRIFLFTFLILLFCGCNTVDSNKDETDKGIHINVKDVNGSNLRDVKVYVNYNYTSVMPKMLGIDTVMYDSFTYTINNSRKVELNWVTNSETSNFGFYVERREQGTSNWIELDFVEGSGTVPIGQLTTYTYTDPADLNGIYYYRLKQVDTDASVHYSAIKEVIIITIPGNYQLLTNSPNPFKQTTDIRFLLPERSNIKVSIEDFDSGSELATVTNQIFEAGSQKIVYDTKNILPNGIYYLSIEAASLISSTTYNDKTVLCKNNANEELLKDDMANYETDKDGNADINIPDLNLGTGLEFVESGTGFSGNNYISNSISLIFIKSGYRSYSESVVIDSVDAVNLDIQLEIE